MITAGVQYPITRQFGQNIEVCCGIDAAPIDLDFYNEKYGEIDWPHRPLNCIVYMAFS